MEKKYRDSKDTALVSGQITDIPSESEVRGRFAIQRTINGIPISANDFPERCSIEDSDALRILLTARQRANGTVAMGVPGESQVIH